MRNGLTGRREAPMPGIGEEDGVDQLQVGDLGLNKGFPLHKWLV